MATIHLDRAALDRLIRERVKEPARAVAGEIADAVRSQGIRVGDRDGGKYEIPLPVRVSEADGVVRVALAHPAGKAVQAKHGALTKAAASKGFEVRG